MNALGRIMLMMLAIPALAACTSIGGSHRHAHAGDYPEAAVFDGSADAAVDLAVSRAAAAVLEQKVLLIFGANWCHDSRALAGWLQTPRFTALTDQFYQVVYIDAGVPQTGEGRNLDLAARFGVNDITSTPTLLVLDQHGNLLNSPEDAKGWRNAASRSEDAIFAALESFTRQ